jgi:hypothetical protein
MADALPPCPYILAYYNSICKKLFRNSITIYYFLDQTKIKALTILAKKKIL